MAIKKFSMFVHKDGERIPVGLIASSKKDIHDWLDKHPDSIPNKVYEQFNTVFGQMKALNTRVDNLVTASTGNELSEVIDARSSYTGTIYPTLKGRLDEEANEVSESIAEIYSGEDIQVLKASIFTKGKYLSSDGSFANSSKMYLSDYIDVDYFDKMQIYTDGMNIFRIAEYDIDKRYITDTYKNITSNTFLNKDTRTKYVVACVGSWSVDRSIDEYLNENNISAQTSISLLWKNRRTNIWNALANGCDPSGTYDCSDIVIDAINSNPDGTIFYFPIGRYLFKKGLILRNRSNVRIVGDGGDFSASGTRFLFEYNATSISIYGGNYLYIKDIALIAQNVENASGIGFYDDTPTTLDCRVSNTHVENVKMFNYRQPIRFDAPSGYNYFDNVHIVHTKGSGACISIGSNFINTYGNSYIIPNYLYFRRCKIDNLGYTANVGFRIACAQMVWITDCDICNFTDGYAIQILNNNEISPKVENIFIQENSLFNNKFGVFIMGSSEIRNIKNVSVINNMITWFNAGGRGVYITKNNTAINTNGLTLIGNVFPFGAVSRDYYLVMEQVPEDKYIAGIGVG